MYVTDRLTDRNSSSKKISSVIYGLSVINIPMDLQMDKVRLKKFIHFIPSINITYHQHNTIFNFVSTLIVKVAFAVILCQLLGIYQRSSFVGNPISNSSIYSNCFLTI
jgi:hypothetical protein